MKKEKMQKCEHKNKKPFKTRNEKNEVVSEGYFCEDCKIIISFENKDEKKEISKNRKIKKQEHPNAKKTIEIQNNINIDDNFINKVYNMNCLDFLSSIPDKSIDYCITSPPYNTGKSKYEDYDDNMKDSEYTEFLTNVIDLLLKKVKHHIFFNIQLLNNNKKSIIKAINNHINNIKDIIIWEKENTPPSYQNGTFASKFELIIIFSNQKPNIRQFLDANFGKTVSNVLYLHNNSNNKFAKINSAVFPLSLPRQIMNMFGSENKIWIDPFIGTGTTAIAAIMENRKYVGCELSEKIYEVCINNIEIAKTNNIIIEDLKTETITTMKDSNTNYNKPNQLSMF